MTPVRIACDQTGCRVVLDTGAEDRAAATVIAGNAGWEMTLEGPEHGRGGWLAYCPAHARKTERTDR